VTFVITQPCIDTTDQSCVEVCPVDCIHFEEGTDRMLYINPVECIDCGACQPACPVTAIFPEAEVPPDQQAFTAINELWYSDPGSARAQVAALLGGAPAPAAAPASTPAPAAEAAPAAETPAAASEGTGAPAGPTVEAGTPTEAPAAATAPATRPTEVPAQPVAAKKPWAPVPHASKADYRKAFAGFHYPISRDAVYRMARDKGGLDREVSRILEQLPLRKYHSEDDLTQAVRMIYRMNGVPEDAIPV
jgi:NAD-dependent dihydropyrimidine dehydrogenase PreA subunit